MTISALAQTESGDAQKRNVPEYVLFMVTVITLVLMVGDILSMATANTPWPRYDVYYFRPTTILLLKALKSLSEKVYCFS